MRKHENFHWGGYKYAPESVWFSINGKHINFPEEVRSRLAYLAVCGENEKLLIELKRALRAEEKKPRVVGKCICFFKERLKRVLFIHSSLDMIQMIYMTH